MEQIFDTYIIYEGDETASTLLKDVGVAGEQLFAYRDGDFPYVIYKNFYMNIPLSSSETPTYYDRTDGVSESYAIRKNLDGSLWFGIYVWES